MVLFGRLFNRFKSFLTIITLGFTFFVSYFKEFIIQTLLTFGRFFNAISDLSIFVFFLTLFSGTKCYIMLKIFLKTI